MELYQLQYMLEVAKHGNFTLAAQEVCVTSSSLSQQIKKLEDELGVVLFERTTRSVHLTPAGVELVAKATNIMDEVANINKGMQKYISGESGTLSIGGTPALKVNGITHKIAKFKNQYQNISINIHEAECLNLYPLLESKKIDVAFLTAFDKYNIQDKIPLEGFPVVEDELVLVTNINHPFASEKEIDLRNASKEKFILFCQSSGLYVQSVDACHNAGFEPNCAYQVQYVDTCLGLVSEGLGVALLSSNSVKNTLWKNIAVIPLKQKISRVLSMVYPKRKKNLSPVLVNFINFFKNEIQLDSLKEKNLEQPLEAKLLKFPEKISV